MDGASLPEDLINSYELIQNDIIRKLEEFKKVKGGDIFYELCFCLCTPQSRAQNAYVVEKKLRELNFFQVEFNPSYILRNPSNYIRFHNNKSHYLLEARESFNSLIGILNSKIDAEAKRNWIYKNIKGMGMKESSHFLRNIGYTGLGILDRHILKHLIHCGVFLELPKISSVNQYLEIESRFKDFSAKVNIPIDELDLLFWSYETGEILK